MNDKIFILYIELNSRSVMQKFEGLTLGYAKPKKIMDNVYGIRASYMVTSKQLRDQLFNQMGTSDFNVFIMRSSVDASWRLPGNVDEWLSSNI